MVRDLFDLDFNRWEIILLFLIPASINLAIFIYVSYFLPRNRSNFSFSVLVLFLGLWQFADGFMRTALTEEIAHEWFRIARIFYLFSIPFGVLFTLNYTGNFSKVSRTALFITQFLPSILCLLIMTARLDNFTVYKSSQWYWISKPNLDAPTLLVYFWTLLQSVFLAFLLWVNYKREDRGKTRSKQALVLALGFTIPVVGGIIGRAVSSFLLNVDVVPITTSLFTAFSIAALIGMKKYRLLDYSPKHQWDRIVEAMSEGLLIVNNKDEIMYANKMLCELLGYEFREIKGKAASELFPGKGENAPLLKSLVEDKRKKVAGSHEVQLKARSGQKIWVSISASHYKDSYGAITGSIGILSDINSLKKAERRFRTLIENAGDIIAMTDRDGKVIYASPSFTNITGFSKEDMKEKEAYAVMHPEKVEESKRALQEILDNPGVPIARTSSYLHKDGHYVLLQGTVINLLDDENVGAIVSNYRDITEERKTQEQLVQNEKWFKTMVEFGNDAIAIMDPEGKLKYLSPNNEKIMGYPIDQLYIRKPENVHPDDRQKLAAKTKLSLESPGETFHFEFRRLHSSGRYIWLEAHLTNMLNDPNINGLLFNYRDVTERKVAEEKLLRSERIYKTIASSITGSVIIMIDSDYRYLLVEGDMVEKFGYTKDNLLGNRIEDVVPADRFKVVEKELKRVFVGEFFTTELSRDGFDIITRYVPLHDENDKVYAALMVSIDVTQLKQTQREIAELNKDLELKVAERTEQLEAANKELESFSYSVSHDLRAPLRAIHGYTQIIQEEYAGKLDEEGRRYMGRVLVNTKKMGQLIDELLTFSRLGKKELSKHYFSMKDMVVSVVNELKSAEAGREIDVMVAELPDVQSDSTTIKQVWLNLVSNAVKYTRQKKKAEIEIGFREEGEEIIYFIRDNGAGFDMTYMDKLFGVFQRLHSDEEFEGIGVGLAIVQRIIQKHGGRVWAEGKEGEGATFYFSLKKN